MTLIHFSDPFTFQFITGSQLIKLTRKNYRKLLFISHFLNKQKK